MRSLFLFIAIWGVTSLSAQPSTQVNSQISDVVVYLKGAQVTRQASVKLQSGNTDIIFNGLTARLNPNNLQVSAGQGVTILSVNHSFNYLQQAKTDERINSLINRRDQLKDSIALTKNTREVSVKEQEMLLKNQSIGGQETGVNVEQLIRATDFFRNRLAEIETTLFNKKREIEDMQKRLNKINRQLSELNAQNDRPTSTVKVSVSTNKAINTPIQITYTVNQAHWRPGYDIRVDDTNQPLALVYNAKVFQNTDEDWNDVNLTLSTGNPSISNYKPELQPWYLKPAPPLPPAKAAHMLSIVEDDVEMDEELIIEDAEDKRRFSKEDASLGDENVSTTQQQTTTAFQIEIPYTIPANNQGYNVAVTTHQIDAFYQYATVPKLSPHVYLLTQITEWNDLNLLPGEANIYFDGTYQGKTHLDPYTSDDTLSLSIGRDPEIIVDREVQKDYSSKTLFGSNRKETKAWKITVRNTKNAPVSVEVEDQYPVSGNSDIKVELEKSNGAKVDPKTGILSWNLDMEPGEIRELNFVYSVRYPKDLDVIIE